MSAVPRPTVYKWLAWFRNEGVAGLEDRSSPVRHRPRVSPPDVEARVRELRRSGRDGPYRIANRFDRAPSTVYAILARHGLGRLSFHDRTSRSPLRYERARAGELVLDDVK